MSVFEFMRRTILIDAPISSVLALERHRRRSLIAAGFAVGTIMAVVGGVVGSTSVDAAFICMAVAIFPSVIANLTESVVVWAFMFPFYAVTMFGASIGLLVASIPLGSTALTAVVSLLVLMTGIPSFIFLFYIIAFRSVGGRGSVGGRRGNR